jgi:hypothetical protein
MHGFWHCQTVTPIENGKQNPARTLPHACTQQASETQQATSKANPAPRQGKPKTMGKTSPWCQTPKSKEKTQH